MPEISRFYGIVITMFYGDHLPPHFHARYGTGNARFTIEPPALLDGSLSSRVIGLVLEWAALHQAELRADWDRAVRLESVEPIEPLE